MIKKEREVSNVFYHYYTLSLIDVRFYHLTLFDICSFSGESRKLQTELVSSLYSQRCRLQWDQGKRKDLLAIQMSQSYQEDSYFERFAKTKALLGF